MKTDGAFSSRFQRKILIVRIFRELKNFMKRAGHASFTLPQKSLL